MKLRILPRGKLLLAVGLVMSLTGCREGANTGGNAAMLPGISPQPILAQIGEELPLPPEKMAGTPGPDASQAVKQEVPPPTGPVPLAPKLSLGVEEVVQLAQAQLGDEVLLAYIENSPMRFNLGADDILYLHDLGLSAPVIAAMIRHDQDLPMPDWETPSQPIAAAPVAEPVGAAVESTEGAPPPTAVAVSTAPEAAGETQVTHNHFYNTLAPYGTWMELPDYGWCWRPTVAVVDRSWRPYAHGGRWIYTDYGWYWRSYYSWGWAPFHYGRWHLSGPHGWVWLPDTHWGPAWVTWRHYDGYYGWAPLPPGAVYSSGIGMTYYGSHVSIGFGFGFSSSYYTFVPIGHFYSHRPWNHCVPHGRATYIYNNSTVINNYVQGDGNNTVINVGPGTGEVAAATRTAIQKVKIREVSSGAPSVVRAESLTRDGTTLNVYRPKLPEQAATPPSTITRRQREHQARASQVSSSEAAQTAVVRARSAERSVAPSVNANPRTTTGPSTAPRAAGNGAAPVRSRTAVPREPAASSEVKSGPTIAPQSPPQTVDRSTPAARPAAPRQGSLSPTPRIEPVRPAPARTTPATPRIEPVRPAPARTTPAAPRTRTAPARNTVNPAYSITPAPSTRLTPRPDTGVPSPVSPRLVAPRVTPSFTPRPPTASPRTFNPPVSPAPARVAPSRSYSAPAPSRAPAPSVVPSRSSGAVRSSPAPSPARPQSAPSAPRSGGTRNR